MSGEGRQAGLQVQQDLLKDAVPNLGNKHDKDHQRLGLGSLLFSFNTLVISCCVLIVSLLRPFLLADYYAVTAARVDSVVEAVNDLASGLNVHELAVVLAQS